MSSPTPSNAGGSDTAAKPLPVKPSFTHLKEKLGPLVKTIQFSWFTGHVFVILSAVLYSLSTFRLFFTSEKFAGIIYRFAYLAIIFTFGIIIKQTYQNKKITPLAILHDDNIHYLLIAFLWLFSARSFSTLLPFIIFSTFHALTYVRSHILPALGYPATSPLSTKINLFIKAQNDRAMQFAASSELATLASLFVSVISFNKAAWVKFAIYLIFVRVRFEHSAFTKAALKTWEVKIDQLVAHPKAPVFLKSAWTNYKNFVRVYIGNGLSPERIFPSRQPTGASGARKAQ
ncbi:hypothetical protein NADFUDRAFT_45325 [Nadsonia fulvescens var. elongata DSM 6958]|uniref:Nucleoporin POM33 n=1 Tax=Nadsonia fulvescens var. elongata DSM 6958 TaxID=857566 RepID=A0A1E3PNW0_9ASCO|nr:hypothetical protein NADFUDRAFT_45325 [Nadsonia fulvescens var. elongata DSM 6958]